MSPYGAAIKSLVGAGVVLFAVGLGFGLIWYKLNKMCERLRRLEGAPARANTRPGAAPNPFGPAFRD